MRIDIRWRDLAVAAFHCVASSFTPEFSQADEAIKTSDAWSPADNTVVTLSVRSATDLLLRTLQLPRGSEVLMTALTVPDMAEIVRAHGLVVVPIDVDQHGHIRPSDVADAVTPKSKMIVVAHLFGGKTPLDEVIEIARLHDILVVEDCAQSFHRVGDTGHAESDMTMFSFGPIKTATALGGAITHVACPDLHSQMKNMLSDDPVQPKRRFARRVIRFAAIKAVSGNRPSAIFRCVVETLGYDFETLAGSIARGFASADLLPQIRHRPSVPLLRLLRHRFETYDFSRLNRRKQLGRMIDQTRSVQHKDTHLHWVYPVFTKRPSELCRRLQAIGFDATSRSRMTVIASSDDSTHISRTTEIWVNVVFLPWYPELTEAAVITMSDQVANFGGSKIDSISDTATTLCSLPGSTEAEE